VDLAAGRHGASAPLGPGPRSSRVAGPGAGGSSPVRRRRGRPGSGAVPGRDPDRRALFGSRRGCARAGAEGGPVGRRDSRREPVLRFLGSPGPSRLALRPRGHGRRGRLDRARAGRPCRERRRHARPHPGPVHGDHDAHSAGRQLRALGASGAGVPSEPGRGDAGRPDARRDPGVPRRLRRLDLARSGSLDSDAPGPPYRRPGPHDPDFSSSRDASCDRSRNTRRAHTEEPRDRARRFRPLSHAASLLPGRGGRRCADAPWPPPGGALPRRVGSPPDRADRVLRRRLLPPIRAAGGPANRGRGRLWRGCPSLPDTSGAAALPDARHPRCRLCGSALSLAAPRPRARRTRLEALAVSRDRSGPVRDGPAGGLRDRAGDSFPRVEGGETTHHGADARVLRQPDGCRLALSRRPPWSPPVLRRRRAPNAPS
jgi:hypothetical protein